MTSLAAPLYIITGVLALAGVAKVLSPTATATALRAIGVPKPLIATRALGAAEVAVSVAAVVTGAAIFWASIAASYAAFAVFIFWALSGNQGVVSCGCFGHEDTPPTPGHAAFNATAAAIAGLSVADPVALGDFDGTAFEAVLAVALIGTGIALSVAALTVLPRTLSLAHGTAAPAAQSFSLNGSPSTSQGNS